MLTALAFSVFASGADTSRSERCRAAAELAYYGAQDGALMASIPDGLDREFTAAQISSDNEARIVASSYLTGYAAGLVGIDPAETAEDFFADCNGEGV